MARDRYPVRTRRLERRVLPRSWFLCVLVALAVMAPVAPALAAPRTVRVGLYENEPKIFTDASTGQPAGIFVDLMKEIADEEGWTLVWVPGTFAEGLKALEAGRIDLMPDVAYSAERAVTFDFHKTPVVESWSYVYAAPGESIAKISDLQGKRVAVLKDSIQEAELEQMAKGFGYDIKLVPTASLQDAFSLAATLTVDAAIANYFFGDYFYKSYALTKTPIVFSPSPLFYAARKGANADLLEAIDRDLDAWIAEPNSVYYQTLARYTTKEAISGLPVWVWWAVGGVGVLLLVSGANIVLLRWRVRVATRQLTDAHAAVAKAEEKLRLAVEAAEEGIFDWNPKTREAEWTPRNFTMLGYDPGEFPVDSDAWAALIHPEDRETVVGEEMRLLGVGDRSFSVLYRMRTKGGDWMWISSRGRAVEVDGEGDAVRVVGTNADVTELKRAEDEVRVLNAELELRVAQRTAQLEEVNQELEAFSYSVSHDLRAPLRHISGYVDLIVSRSRDELSEKTKHYLDNVALSVVQMGALIDDLLKFSRTNRMEMRKGDVDTDAVVAKVRASLADDTAGRDIEWNVPPLPHVTGDEALLAIVWSNLIDNAVKYTRGRSPAKIDISAEETPDETVFAVRDNGAGFDMQYAAKLFGVFQRLHTAAEFEGTGIGLANVRRIVDRHGGRAWAEAEPGKGATFRFSIPKKEHR